VNKTLFVNKLYSVLVVFFVAFTSLYILPYYIYGDQVHYQRLYDGIYGLSLSDGYLFYTSNIDSREPGYFFLAWVSSNLGIDKTYFITFFNIILVYLAYRYLIKLGGHPFVVFLIVSFSYYSYVLFFSAERLKFGFIFLLIGLLYDKRSSVFYLLSVVTHAQIIIVFASSFMLKIKDDIVMFFTKFMVTKKFLLFLVTVFSITTIVFLYMQEHLLSKFNSYFELKNIIEISKLFSFFALSFLYAKKKSDVVMFFIPLFFFTLIFGGERVNFIGYFAFLYFSIYYKKGFNLGIVLTTAYFLYAGSNFVLNVLEYGNAYHSL